MQAQWSLANVAQCEVLQRQRTCRLELVGAVLSASLERIIVDEQPRHQVIDRVAVLDDEQLRDYREMAEGLGMAALIEAHDLSEVERGLSAGASLLGINNRNLKTFDTNLKTTIDLIREIPPEVVLVSESGVHSKEDVSMLGDVGVDAVLVGESLLRKDDPGEGVRNLSGQDKRGRTVG